MRVPYNWLREYIQFDLSPQELAEKFTQSGIEVGAVERFGCSLPGVVVGLITNMEPHPARKNLTLVQADIGSQSYSIVCGANNMLVGDKVVVATPGSELPDRRIIKEANIHGVASSGMLCSAAELGVELGSEDDILILENNSKIGSPVEELLGFDDFVLHLELTPNRADCLSMIGVAYEVAALTGQPVNLPPLVPLESVITVDRAVQVKVIDTELCPRYTARVLNQISIGSAPLWMQLKLLKAGIRPINSVVDSTNYVMWELGQPLHAFDLQKLKNREIIVRRALKGEKLVTLDGQERTLDPEVLVIADNHVPVGLAGVMGGENTEISTDTVDVLLEAANFSPTSIRQTARRFNLLSEASQRFEKGVNPEAILWAQDRAAWLISELAGGTVLKGIIDQNCTDTHPSMVQVRPARISKILGMDIDRSEVLAILSRLRFTVAAESEDSLSVKVPLRRPDITLEEDIIEEVARLHGYDKIPVTLPCGKMLENRETTDDRLIKLIRNHLVSCGYYECVTYSFINPANLDRLRLAEDDIRLKTIPVQNPFSEEQAVMRTTIIPGLIKVVQHNLSHREQNLLFYEIGTVYEPDSLPLDKPPVEKVKITMAVTGMVPEPNWIISSQEADFFMIKGTLESLFDRLQIKGVQYKPAGFTFTHPTRSALLALDGAELGFIGQLHPEIAEEYEIDQAVYICELDLALLNSQAKLVPEFRPLPRYPSAKRDIALVVSREIPAAQLDQIIRNAGGKIVSQVKLFDLYEGEQIPKGKRSLAYSITYRSEESTLTDAEVNRVQKNIEKALLEAGAVIRS